MMNAAIFYSWQSDSPRAINQVFIEDALGVAVSRIAADASLQINPAVDRDTQQTPGSPAIADTIFEKISSCGLFVCDVTIVTGKPPQRLSSNPNVLLELGFAAAKKGWERIICVMNEEFGGPSKLPFDLQGRRWPIRYRLSAGVNETKKAEIMEQLSQEFEYAIRNAISSGLLINSINPKDKRVAIKLNHAVRRLYLILPQLLNDAGCTNSVEILNSGEVDAPGSSYPRPELVEPIIAALRGYSLLNDSNVMIDNTTLSWMEALCRELANIANTCNRILDQYADREEHLISLTDEMVERSYWLRFMMETTHSPEIRALYESGIPDVHVDFFRQFFLLVVKVFRVTVEFGVTV